MNEGSNIRSSGWWTRGRARVHATLVACLLALGLAAVPALAGTRTVTVTASQSAVRLTVGGKPVHTLTHGAYRFVIHDRSRRCGFRLANTSGIVLRTGRKFVGTATRSATLEAGSYYYSCGQRSGLLRVR
jgi:hypothetical protein